MNKILSEKPFPNYLEKFEISICYCIWENQFLFLRRSLSCREGGFWTAPSGKLESGETPLMAAKRELAEETELSAPLEGFHFLRSFFARTGTLDFKINLFAVQWKEKPQRIGLSPREHDLYRWVPSEEVLFLPLMVGAGECFQKATKLLERSPCPVLL